MKKVRKEMIYERVFWKIVQLWGETESGAKAYSVQAIYIVGQKKKEKEVPQE